MKFVVQNLENENHFYDCGESLLDLNRLRIKAWQENVKKVKVRIYNNDMNEILHEEIINTVF